jgi:hypothetical protein
MAAFVSAMMLPVKVSHTRSQRDSSSKAATPELKISATPHY